MVRVRLDVSQHPSRHKATSFCINDPSHSATSSQQNCGASDEAESEEAAFFSCVGKDRFYHVVPPVEAFYFSGCESI